MTINPHSVETKATIKPIQILHLTLSACFLYAITAGLRSNYGLLINAIVSHCSVSYTTVSFIIAIGQLVYGIMQPLFGIIAIKKGNRFVLMLGALLMIVGILLVPLCSASLPLLASLGILLPAGTGAISFGIIMGTITPSMGEQKAAAISGLVSASSGIGSTALSPLIQTLLSAVGLPGTMGALALPILLIIPISHFMSKGPMIATIHSEEKNVNISSMIKEAASNPSYIFATLGFFTCGFHMAIIETHVYSEFISYGIAENTAAVAFSCYGIATMIGCIISGFASAKIQMKWVLTFLYGFRAVFIIGFLLIPKNTVTAFGFAVLLGLSSASTVTPTSGIVNKLFGAAKLATLFGLCFLSHQIGSFLSAWIGGLCVDATNSYTLIWVADIVLCFIAALLCAKIKEDQIVSPQMQ